jgi:hypothetical protein
MSLFGYGFGMMSASGGSAGYEGPDAANLELWWSATSPLLSLEGSSIVFSPVGVPTLDTVRGRAVLENTASGAMGYDTAPGAFPLGDIAPERITAYLLAEPTNGSGSMQSFIHDGVRTLLVSGGVGFVQARIHTDTGLVDDIATTPLINTPTIFSLEWRGDTTDDIEATDNKTRSGTPSAVTPAGAPVVDRALVNLSNQGRLWDALWFKGAAYNPAVVDYLLGLLI